MKITLRWLQKHLETKCSLGELLEVLPRLGFPVAHVQDWGSTLGSFKVALIREVTPHPQADRLRLCTIETGTEVLQVVCGAPNVQPGFLAVLALPGDCIPDTGQILQKGVIRGIESHGMLCSAAELKVEEEIEGGKEGIILLDQTTAPVSTPFLECLGLDDPVVEIEVTPNRGDALGVRGVARELAAAGCGRLLPLKVSEISSCTPMPHPTGQRWPSFAYASLRNLNPVASAPWMQKFLKAVGVKPFSAIVDVTNFLAYDQARPLHAFDQDRLQGSIHLGVSQGGETFEGLDGKNYLLPQGIPVVLDQAGIVAVAGILGGKRTACHEQTRHILLESAFFSPEDIARAGQALGIHTDARTRFERGVDPKTVLSGLAQGIQLIHDMCGGDMGEISVLEEKDWPLQHHILREERLQTLGGCTVSLERSVNILESLGFHPRPQEKEIHVTTPSWRFDIGGEADLVEEVLRMEGYDKILSHPWPFRPTASALTSQQERSFKVLDMLVAQGFQEVVTWSFLSPEKAEKFGGGTPQLRLQNPISRELSVMRPSLLPHLLDIALTHQSRSIPWSGFVEVGPAYQGILPQDQQLVVGGLLSPEREDHWRLGETIDVFMTKAHVLKILQISGVGLQALQTTKEGPSWYHPGRSGTLKRGGKTLAHLGELHPSLLKEWGLEGPLWGFEVFLHEIPPGKPPFPRPPLPLSPYQSMALDLAFLVDQTLPAESLLKLIQKVAGPEIQELTVFDVFEDAHKVGVGKKSLGIRLVFQSMTETLTDRFIQEKIKVIAAEVLDKLGALLRDGGAA